MYICICQAVTDSEIRACVSLGANSLDELREHLGVAAGCGQCASAAAALLCERADTSCKGAHTHLATVV
jgi:bacterioferritin-associated ferredoxin